VRRAVAVAVGLLLCATTSAAAGPIRFSAALGAGARLESSTSLTLRLGVPNSLPPLTEARLLTPAGIDLTASGLGLATCVRPETEILAVMHAPVHQPCPANALMGTGTATAQLRFDPEEIYSATARLLLYAGEAVADRPGLLVLADAYRPVRAQLTYRGYLYVPPPGFGVGMALAVSPIPQPPFGVPVALSAFRLTVGGSSIRYARTSNGRRTSYRPEAIPLPRSCPNGGFRFRAVLRFEGGHREVRDTRVPCPPSAR
jgi:hypothetical protein